MYTIKETNMETIVNETKSKFMYKVIAKVSTKLAQATLNAIISQFSVIGAYAVPSKDTIYIRNDIHLGNEIMLTLIRHEQGHIMDYHNRGAIRFYCTTITSYIQKLFIMKEMLSINSVEETNALILKYHNTSIERYANKTANLDPHVFCIDEKKMYKHLVDTGIIGQEEFNEWEKGEVDVMYTVRCDFCNKPMNKEQEVLLHDEIGVGILGICEDCHQEHLNKKPTYRKDAYDTAMDKGYDVGIPGADHEVYCPWLDDEE